MLIDPVRRALTIEEHQTCEMMIKKFGRYEPGATRLQTGVYLGQISRFVVQKNTYPRFEHWMMDFINRSLEREPTSEHWLQAKAEHEAPEVVETLYRRENWPTHRSNAPTHIEPYGIVDSPDQLLSLYDFEQDPRYLCIHLMPHTQTTGIRWHKHGTYLGFHARYGETFGEHDEMERIYTYRICELPGPTS